MQAPKEVPASMADIDHWSPLRERQFQAVQTVPILQQDVFKVPADWSLHADDSTRDAVDNFVHR